MLAEYDQLIVLGSRLLALEPSDQLPVDLQVGIAANRRGEVAIVVAGERIVSLGLGRVVRLLEAAEQSVVDRVFLGRADGLLEDSLELEPALRLVELEAEAAGRTRRTGPA